jgi:hypothetical protein
MNGGYRGIDGVDVWPMLVGTNSTQPRLLTPTTEASIIQAAAFVPTTHVGNEVDVDASGHLHGHPVHDSGDTGSNGGGGSAEVVVAGTLMMWKLVTLAGQSNYYTQNATNIKGTDPCKLFRLGWGGGEGGGSVVRIRTRTRSRTNSNSNELQICL